MNELYLKLGYDSYLAVWNDKPEDIDIGLVKSKDSIIDKIVWSYRFTEKGIIYG